MTRGWWLLVLAVVLADRLAGEVTIQNPGLPDQEECAYSETIGSDPPRSYRISLSLVSAPAHYEVHSTAVDFESWYRLDPHTLISFWSRSANRETAVTVVRTTEYQRLEPTPGADDLVVTDLGSLPVVLRGFPWGKVTYAKLLYLGNTNFSGPGLGFELKVLGIEKIQAAGRTWDCWHATTGLAGAVGWVLPKTDWWFAADGSHVLVKFVGPQGGPGSPLRSLTLERYFVPSESKAPPAR